ncbi:unnamed protein product, partial [Amoebophrya sp. A120]|eukprot:GSA120T00002086001.1
MATTKEGREEMKIMTQEVPPAPEFRLLEGDPPDEFDLAFVFGEGAKSFAVWQFPTFKVLDLNSSDFFTDENDVDGPRAIVSLLADKIRREKPPRPSDHRPEASVVVHEVSGMAEASSNFEDSVSEILDAAADAETLLA